MAPAILIVEFCRDISLLTADRKWHDSLVKQAGSVPGCPPGLSGGCGRKRVMAKLSCLMECMSRPLQDTPSERRSFRDMLLPRLWRVKDRSCLPAACRRTLQPTLLPLDQTHHNWEIHSCVISVYPKTLHPQYSLCVMWIQQYILFTFYHIV